MWKAIRDVADNSPEAGATISLALWWNCDAAAKAVEQALHTFGGQSHGVGYGYLPFDMGWRQQQAKCRLWADGEDVFVRKFLSDARDLLDLTAPYSLLQRQGPAGLLNLCYRHAQGTTIYGGTSEVHRSMIAERALGMPRTRA